MELKILKKNLAVKILSISTLIVLLFITSYGYKQYNDYKMDEERYSQIYSSMEELMDDYIETVLRETSRKAEDVLTAKTNIVQDRLLESYSKDLTNLEYDIQHPSNDSKLSTILNDVLGCHFINEDTSSNKVFAISTDNIIWNRYLQIPNNNTYMTLDGFISNMYNKSLAEQAIFIIKNTNYLENSEFIFWQPMKVLGSSVLINDMDISNIIELYKKGDIDSLKSCELLVPVYITKDGDIFGTKDINNLGIKTKNYKITVIQRINIYDSLKPYMTEIKEYQHNMDKVKSLISDSQKYRAYNMIQSIITIIFVLIGSGILQNKIPEQK